MPFLYESKYRLICQDTQMVHGGEITLVENAKKKARATNVIPIFLFKFLSQMIWHIFFAL